jgi:hypothetical protein
MDRWTRLKGRVTVIRDLRSSHDQVVATCWNAGGFIGVIVRGRRTGQTVDETILQRRRANKSQPSRCDVIPTGRVVSVLWGLGGLARE